MLLDHAGCPILLCQSEYKPVSNLGTIFNAINPMLMTTFAMVLGAVPLALATGAGSKARQQIGVVIVGGMSIGTLFTLFVVPILYILFIKSG